MISGKCFRGRHRTHREPRELSGACHGQVGHLTFVTFVTWTIRASYWRNGVPVEIAWRLYEKKGLDPRKIVGGGTKENVQVQTWKFDIKWFYQTNFWRCLKLRLIWARVFGDSQNLQDLNTTEAFAAKSDGNLRCHNPRCGASEQASTIWFGMFCLGMFGRIVLTKLFMCFGSASCVQITQVCLWGAERPAFGFSRILSLC